MFNGNSQYPQLQLKNTKKMNFLNFHNVFFFTIQLSKIDSQQPEREWEEVQIDVPWGVIAGKWYGDREQQPVLAIHGWQDNAGTFDRLLPLLPQCIPILAIDLPGHGLSSHYPTGMVCTQIVSY